MGYNRAMHSTPFQRGVWRLADPKISLASFAGMFLAGCFAAADGELHLGWLLLTLLGVFLVEVGKNASGEVVDYDSGTDQAVLPEDRSPFSGGKRVLVDELLTHRQTWAIALGCFLAAIACGLFIAVERDSRVLWLGAAGMALAWFYHGGSLRLAYRGLGELAVAIAYGPLVVCGTYLVQTGTLTTALLHAACSLGLLVAAFLWINEFPDYAADAAAGKRNLVVRLGKPAAQRVFTALVLVAYGWLLAASVHTAGAQGMAAGLIGVVPALVSIVVLHRSGGVTTRLIPAQAACLLSFVLMALGSGLGYLLLPAA
ncbi:MAG: prenyltransferase [Halioglobus sp.]